MNQPYTDNTPETDAIDYESLIAAFGLLNMFSTRVLADVIDYLQTEVDSRPAPENEDWRSVGGSREKNSITGEAREYVPDTLEDSQRGLPKSSGVL